MRRHRRHSIEFKREIVQAHLDGETLYRLAMQHGVDSNLIRGRVRKYESGELDAEVVADLPRFIDDGYYARRLHSALGYLRPIDYEEKIGRASCRERVCQYV